MSTQFAPHDPVLFSIFCDSMDWLLSKSPVSLEESFLQFFPLNLALHFLKSFSFENSEICDTFRHLL